MFIYEYVRVSINPPCVGTYIAYEIYLICRQSRFGNIILGGMPVQGEYTFEKMFAPASQNKENNIISKGNEYNQQRTFEKNEGKRSDERDG